MTVLGKVAKVTVPKPINLPSQRYLVPAELFMVHFTDMNCFWPPPKILHHLSVVLRLENHGLDPSVEIVPK